MLVLAGVFRLIGDLLAFIGPWCIEVIVEYAYKEIGAKQHTLQNQTTQDSLAVTYSPLPAANNSNVTLPPETDDVVGIQNAC